MPAVANKEESAYDTYANALEKAKRIRDGLEQPVSCYRAPDPEEIRERLGLSQSKFAALLGVSARTLQNWEQGRRMPTGPAAMLLRIAERHPEVLLETHRALPIF